jgi:phosphotriesterase-related protein
VSASTSTSATVPTVAGELPADRLGTVLMHEHVFILTPELEKDYPAILGWDEEARVRQAVAHLTEARLAGVDTILDLTVLGMGRDVSRVQRVAAEAGMQVVAATGLYTYDELPRFLQYVGPEAMLKASEPMVEMFVKDIRDGIGDTDVRAGMLKCATDAAGVTPGVERVLRAVAQAHRETGAPITTHSHARSGNGRDQLDVFESEGVDLTAVVIGHSGDSDDLSYLRSLADRGATLGMDRFGLDGGRYLDTDTRIEVVAELCRLGYADRMVLSHDVTCWMDWAPRELWAGSVFDSPDWTLRLVHDRVLPGLSERGVAEADLTRMLVENPRRLLSRPVA